MFPAIDNVTNLSLDYAHKLGGVGGRLRSTFKGAQLVCVFENAAPYRAAHSTCARNPYIRGHDLPLAGHRTDPARIETSSGAQRNWTRRGRDDAAIAIALPALRRVSIRARVIHCCTFSGVAGISSTLISIPRSRARLRIGPTMRAGK